LCIGATTAIFSSVYSLMLKPLPYPQPEQIVELYSSASKAGLDHMPANVPFYKDYSQNAKSYDTLGLWTFGYSLVGEKDSVVAGLAQMDSQAVVRVDQSRRVPRRAVRAVEPQPDLLTAGRHVLSGGARRQGRGR